MSERGALAAFWFPAALWMLSILDHAKAGKMAGSESWILLFALASCTLRRGSCTRKRRGGSRSGGAMGRSDWRRRQSERSFAATQGELSRTSYGSPRSGERRCFTTAWVALVRSSGKTKGSGRATLRALSRLRRGNVARRLQRRRWPRSAARPRLPSSLARTRRGIGRPRRWRRVLMRKRTPVSCPSRKRVSSPLLPSWAYSTSVGFPTRVLLDCVLLVNAVSSSSASSTAAAASGTPETTTPAADMHPSPVAKTYSPLPPPSATPPPAPTPFIPATIQFASSTAPAHVANVSSPSVVVIVESSEVHFWRWLAGVLGLGLAFAVAWRPARRSIALRHLRRPSLA